MFERRETLNNVAAPQCCAGAPEPVLFADEHQLRFAYGTATASEPGPYRELKLRSDDQSEPCAIVDVEGCSIFKFGSPNDEAISGHRLAKIGLTAYAAFEVSNSTWIAELERANRVHHRHDPRMFSSLRHFIFTFHDSTLEFVSRSGFKVRHATGSPRQLLLISLVGS